MIKRFIIFICLACIFAGAIVVLGAAGSSDLGTMETNTVLAHGIVGVLMVWGGFMGLKVFRLV